MPTIFHSTSGLLTSYLQAVGAGKIQLPDFQRSWVWDDERIRKLLVSILQSYSIGAIMSILLLCDQMTLALFLNVEKPGLLRRLRKR